jgi:hypothetical protein
MGACEYYLPPPFPFGHTPFPPLYTFPP